MSHRTRERRRRPHTVPDQRALLAAATRRGHVADPDEELTVIRIPSGGPARTYTIPAPPADFVPYPPARRPAPTHPLGAPEPLAPGHAHADTVLDELRAATAALDPRPADEHVTHHQVPREWLCTVPLIDPDAALCDEIELMLARLAAAYSDALAARGFQAIAAAEALTGCCPECGLIVELVDGQLTEHYSLGTVTPCAGSGNEPEGSAR